jgi:hypothetical protein
MLLHRMSGAALVIGRFYRAHIIRQRLATMIYWHHFEVAIQLQRVVRGHLARVQCRRQIIKFRRTVALRRKRVIMVQAMWRGIQGRQRAAAVRARKEAARAERRRRKKEKLEEFARMRKSWGKRWYRLKRSAVPFRYVFGEYARRQN